MCSVTLRSLFLQAQHSLRCLRGSIRDAVALILCPQGTADMDKCKLLTWCCLLCCLIKGCVALLSHNLPPNMLSVSATETSSLFFVFHVNRVYPTWIDTCGDNKTIIYDLTRLDLPLSNEFIWQTGERAERAYEVQEKLWLDVVLSLINP